MNFMQWFYSIWFVILIIICLYFRFNYPSLTETQLFLNYWGLYVGIIFSILGHIIFKE